MGRPRRNSRDLKVKEHATCSSIVWTVQLLALAVSGWFLWQNIESFRQAMERRHETQVSVEKIDSLMGETLGLLDDLKKDVEKTRARLRKQSEGKLVLSNPVVKGDTSGGESGGSLSFGRTIHLLRKLEVALRPPPGSNLVVILGVKFILDRDFEIWDHTFTNARHRVVKTTKKKLMKGENSDWKVLKCLDLFDGKSHCIEPKNLLELERHQRVSRLYGLRKTLWNKDRFCDTMNLALKGFDVEMEFVFPCWLLPNDYKDLIQGAKTKYAGRSFILKPTDRGEGNGIIVLDTWKQLIKWKTRFPDNDEVVVQTYLPNPFLINQRKWDMRTYVLVTSVHPLRVYMYRDGLVRFASSKYEKNAKGGGKQTAFLTNTSVNKKNGVAVDELTWPFPKVYRWLRRNGFDPDMLWTRIESAVTRMLLSAEPSFAQLFDKLQKGYTCVNCYQLLGVDVIVDDEVVPRVIEVNGEPSMQLTGEVGSHYDYTKKSMTRDLVALVFGMHNVSEQLASDLMDLELEGHSIGFQSEGCDSTSHDFCLSKEEVEYLLEMKREEVGMGGFRRIYPSRLGDKYTSFVKHLSTKFSRDSKVGSYRIHRIATKLAKLSKLPLNNSIDDPNYVHEDED